MTAPDIYMYPDEKWIGMYNRVFVRKGLREAYIGHDFKIEFFEEYALAGLSPYYLHRSRYKGDKMKNKRNNSPLPIPECDVRLGGPIANIKVIKEVFYGDVTLHDTFGETLTYLGNNWCLYEYTCYEDIEALKYERDQIEKRLLQDHLSEKAKITAEFEIGQLSLF